MFEWEELGGSPQNSQVVNNHGDRFHPLRIGLWDPFQMAYLMADISLG